jgi:hypothetical protein
MQPMAGPCDSPKVVTENSLPNVLPDMDARVLSKRNGRFYQQPPASAQRPVDAPSKQRKKCCRKEFFSSAACSQIY